MTNEHYLTVSYFAIALVSLGFGVAAYRVLRRPFTAICETLPGKSHLSTWKRTLAVSLTMAALLGFLSVSYRYCGKSYAEIVNDRSYLVQVNRNQIQATAESIVYAVFGWCLVIVIFLVIARKRRQSPGDLD